MAVDDSKLIERLRPVVVSLRVDLDANREVFADQTRYILRDPISSQTFAFSAQDYLLLVQIDTGEPLGEIFQRLVSEGRISQEDEGRFFRFVVDLHRSGLVNLPVPDYQALFSRYRAKLAAGLKRRITGFLFMQVPLCCPDAFLNRTVKYVRFLFTPWFFALWSVFILGVGYVVFHRWSELIDPLASILNGDGLFLMWLALILLKVIHEFGHAYACKSFGGDVPEMGAFFIVGSPSAYVDASAAWSFPRRRHRIIVSMAGMYVESIVGGCALLYWAASPPSPLHNLAYQIFLLSTLITLGFNANPLMRFDGYFILSDVLGVPNLRQRASDQVRNVFDRWILGLRRIERPIRRGLAFILVTYGVSSVIYKAFLVLGLCTLIATKLYWLGLGLAAYYVGTTFWGFVIKSARHLLWDKATAPVRRRGAFVAFAAFFVLPSLAFLLDVERPVIGLGTLGMTDEQMARTAVPGTLRSLTLHPGARVEPGQVITHLENRALQDELALVLAELDAAHTRHRIVQFEDRALASRHKEEIRHLEEKSEMMRTRVEKLIVRATFAGRVLTVQDPLDQHAFHRAGSDLCLLGSGEWTIRILMGAEDLAEAAPTVGMTVSLRIGHQPARTRDGRVIAIAPSGSRQVKHAELTQAGGGNIAVSADRQEANEPYFQVTVVVTDVGSKELLPYGARAAVRFRTQKKPIFQHAQRWVARFVQQLKVGGGA